MFKKLFSKIDYQDVARMQIRKDYQGLEKALNYQPDIYIRMKAAETLEEMGDSKANALLQSAFVIETDNYVLTKIVRALMKIDPESAMELFIDQINGINYDESIRSLRQMQKNGATIDKRAIAPLTQLVQKRERSKIEGRTLTLLKDAIDVLGNMGDPVVIPTLLEALDDQNRYIREAAVNGLARFHDPGVKQSVIGLFFDLSRPKDIDSMRYTLDSYDPNWQSSKEAEDSLHQLFTQWRVTSSEQRKSDPLQTLKNVRWIPKDDFERAVHFYLGSQWNALAELNGAAVEAVKLIMELETRKELIGVLEKIGNPQAIQLLFQIISKSPISSPHAFQMSTITLEALAALERMGTAAMDEMLKEYYQPKFSIGDNLAISMGRTGDPRSVKPLIDLAKTSPVWSQRAIESLENIVLQKCSLVDSDSLELLAALEPVDFQDKDMNEFGYSSYSKLIKIDTTKLNQAAKQELEYRAAQA